AEGGAVACERRRFEPRAPHQTRRAARVQPARRVEDGADGDPEAVLERADRIRERAVELDLRGREQPCAELVLQLADAKAVRRAVDAPRHEEAAEARGAVGRAARTRGDDELVRVRDRAEPLLAVQAPRVAVGDRRSLVRADVGASLDLREELRATM